MDFCDTRNRLLNEWTEAAVLYNQLVASLLAAVGAMAEEDFAHLLKMVRIAADLCNRSQKDFERHIKTHTCCR